MSNLIRPYVALDLETTGLATDKVHILELGAVFDDGVSPIDELTTFNAIIKEDHYEYSEPYAMQLNKEILRMIATNKGMRSEYPVHSPALAFDDLAEFIKPATDLARQWDEDHNVKYPSSRISLAGKNISTFDWPIIQNNLDRMVAKDADSVGYSTRVMIRNMLQISHKDGMFKRRFMDLGSMYYSKFGYIPSQGEIMEHLGLDNVPHRATQDAMQVVKGIRSLVGIRI